MQGGRREREFVPDCPPGVAGSRQRGVHQEGGCAGPMPADLGELYPDEGRLDLLQRSSWVEKGLRP